MPTGPDTILQCPQLDSNRGRTSASIHNCDIADLRRGSTTRASALPHDVLVQRRRDRRAALKLIRKLLRKQGFAPKIVVTDKLLSYGAAFHRIGPTCHYEQELRKNDRAENSQQETPRAVSGCQVLCVECVLALPLGQMAHVVAPLCHSQFDIGIDKARTQRLAERR